MQSDYVFAMTIAAPLPDFSSELDNSDIAKQARVWLALQREFLYAQFLQTRDADVYLHGHTHAIDQLIKSLHALESRQRQKSMVMVAVGGYGRSELYPYSDIDIVFLYEPLQAKQASEVAQALLYRLWDIGLTLGHAHREAEEALLLCARDVTVRTSLIDARYLAGDADVFSRFARRLQREVVDPSALDFVEKKLAERDARHLRFGDSRYMLEPNVKEGKGALRDVHTLWWLARATHPVASLSDFARKQLLSPEEYTRFDAARQFLARVRIFLHAIAGHGEDRLTFDRQQEIAVLMGFSHPQAHMAVARFMRRYFVAVRTIGSITRIFCALLEDEKKRKPKQTLGWLKEKSWALGHFYLEGERLNIKPSQGFAQNPLLMLELFKTAQQHDLDIHPNALQIIARHLYMIDGSLRKNAKANAIFLEILLSPKGPEATLRRMSDAGVLGKFIPDFGRIIGQTQFNMHHVYTVDEHTLVALGYLHQVETGALVKTVPLASELMPRISMRRVLYLAVLCHDIAKGRGGDHSQLGEKIATKLAVRFGFSSEEMKATAWLVKQHLLLSNTAFKRDINDPKTLNDFVAEVQTPERLKLLLVLTVADMCAVRPGVWNAWKGALMRELFHRTQQKMGAKEARVGAYDVQQLRSDILHQLRDGSERELEDYLAQGNPSYWLSLSASQHAIVARMLRQAQIMSRPLLIDTQHDYEHGMTEVMVCALDAHGLFSKLAGALTLAGANIITAKIFTLKNGLAMDIFQLQDAGEEVFDRPQRLTKMSIYIEQALSGELDLTEVFHQRTKVGTRRITGESSQGQIFIDNDASSMHTVVEVTAHDRSGLLYRITQALSDMGCSIATAHISTYGAQACDVFYVKDAFGMKIVHEAKIHLLKEKIREATYEAGRSVP